MLENPLKLLNLIDSFKSNILFLLVTRFSLIFLLINYNQRVWESKTNEFCFSVKMKKCQQVLTDKEQRKTCVQVEHIQEGFECWF